MKYLKIEESEIITETKNSILEKICSIFLRKKLSIEEVSHWLLEIDENEKLIRKFPLELVEKY
jgi:hypothetical protein